MVNEDPSLRLAEAVRAVTLTEIKPKTKLLMEPELREGSLLTRETASVTPRIFCHIPDFFFFNVTLRAGLWVKMSEGSDVFGSW